MKSKEELDALYIKGRNYKYGRDGYPVNEKKAFECYYEGAEEEHIDSQWSLGRAFLIGMGCEKNPIEGVRWIKVAAEQGHVGANLSVLPISSPIFYNVSTTAGFVGNFEIY